MDVHPFDHALFGSSYTTPELQEIFSERQMLQRWLDVEVALAAAQAQHGVIPREAAEQIRRHAAIQHFDVPRLAKEIAETVHPLMPILHQLAEKCGPAGEYVHWGATTQDIIDTGTALQLKAVYGVVRRDLRRLIDGTMRLAARHRDTLMAGRTHGQHAVPMTFGFKLAVWIGELVRGLERFEQSAPRVLVGQLSGAVGTMAGYGDLAFEVQRTTLTGLGLGVPVVSWHAARDGMAEFVLQCGLLGGTLGKMANEIISLQATEIAELEEPHPRGRIGSSTMPHKRNPLLCEQVVVASKLLRDASPTALDGLVHRHERDGSPWGTERVRVPESACLLCGALATLVGVMEGLTVRPERMRANLGQLGGLIMSEAVMLTLAQRIGRQTAHEVVISAAMTAQESGQGFLEVLRRDERVKTALDERALLAELDPRTHIGHSGRIVDQVLGWAQTRLDRDEDNVA